MSADITSLAIELSIGVPGTERCFVTANDSQIPLVAFGLFDEPAFNIELDDEQTIQTLYNGVYEQFRIKFAASPYTAQMTFAVYLQAMTKLMDLPTSYCSLCPYKCSMFLKAATQQVRLAA